MLLSTHCFDVYVISVRTRGPDLLWIEPKFQRLIAIKDFFVESARVLGPSLPVVRLLIFTTHKQTARPQGRLRIG